MTFDSSRFLGFRGACDSWFHHFFQCFFACKYFRRVVFYPKMQIRANGGRRGRPGRGASGAVLRPALNWPAVGRGAGAGPKRVRTLPLRTQFVTGKKVWANHLANSVRKVAKWRWLCRLRWTRPGQTQCLAGTLAALPFIEPWVGNPRANQTMRPVNRRDAMNPERRLSPFPLCTAMAQLARGRRRFSLAVNRSPPGMPPGSMGGPNGISRLLPHGFRADPDYAFHLKSESALNPWGIPDSAFRVTKPSGVKSPGRSGTRWNGDGRCWAPETWKTALPQPDPARSNQIKPNQTKSNQKSYEG